MSLETAIQNLADAINNLASSSLRASDTTLVLGQAALMQAEKTPAKPAKKTKAEAEPIPPPVAPDAPPPVEVPAAPTGPVSKDDVRAQLIAVVKKHGGVACGNLCQKYGAPNLSAVDPKHWAALKADADALLEKDSDLPE